MIRLEKKWTAKDFDEKVRQFKSNKRRKSSTVLNLSMDDADNLAKEYSELEDESEDDSEFEAKRAKDAENKVIQDIFGGKVNAINQENELNLMIVAEAETVISSSLRKFHKEVQTEDNMVNKGTQTDISLAASRFDEMFSNIDIIEDLAKELEFKKALMDQIVEEEMNDRDLEDKNKDNLLEKLNKLASFMNSHHDHFKNKDSVSLYQKRPPLKQMSLELELPELKEMKDPFQNEIGLGLSNLRPTLSNSSGKMSISKGIFSEFLNVQGDNQDGRISDRTIIHKSSRSPMLSPQGSWIIDGINPIPEKEETHQEQNTPLHQPVSMISIEKVGTLGNTGTLNLDGFIDKDTLVFKGSKEKISPFSSGGTGPLSKIVEEQVENDIVEGLSPKNRNNPGYTITVQQSEHIAVHQTKGENQAVQETGIEKSAGHIEVTFGLKTEGEIEHIKKTSFLEHENHPEKPRDNRNNFKVSIIKSDEDQVDNKDEEVDQQPKLEDKNIPQIFMNLKPGKKKKTMKMKQNPGFNLLSIKDKEINKSEEAHSVQGGMSMPYLSLVQQLTYEMNKTLLLNKKVAHEHMMYEKVLKEKEAQEQEFRRIIQDMKEKNDKLKLLEDQINRLKDLEPSDDVEQPKEENSPEEDDATKKKKEKKQRAKKHKEDKLFINQQLMNYQSIEGKYNQTNAKTLITKLNLGKFANFKNPMSLKTVMRTIHTLYVDRMEELFQKPETKNLAFCEYVYNYYMQVFGIKQICEKKFTYFVLSLKFHAQYFRVNLFSRFLGLIEQYQYDEDLILIFFEGMRFLESNNKGFAIKTKDTSVRVYYPYSRAVDYIHHLFDDKIPRLELIEFRKQIEKLKEADPSSLNSGIIDMDVFLEKVIEKYAVIVNGTKQYVIDAFKACDLDGNNTCSVNEFLLLNRYLEPKTFDLNTCIKHFLDNADLIDNKEHNMSFNKFAVVCTNFNLFSEKSQNEFLNVKNKDEQEILYIKVKAHWGEKYKSLTAALESFQSLTPEEIENWKTVLEVLNGRMQLETAVEIKPTLIAFRMTELELERIKDEDEIDEDDDDNDITRIMSRRTIMPSMHSRTKMPERILEEEGG